MKIAKVNIVLDYKNDVFRELEINVENNLEVLHHSIVAAFNLNVEEMASFYSVDDDWNQETEFPLIAMDGQSEEMKNVKIQSLLSNIGDRLLYLHDFFVMWRFTIVVEEMKEDADGNILSFGEMPNESPNVQFVSDKNNEDDESDEIAEFDEFDEFGEY